MFSSLFIMNIHFHLIGSIECYHLSSGYGPMFPKDKALLLNSIVNTYEILSHLHGLMVDILIL